VKKYEAPYSSCLVLSSIIFLKDSRKISQIFLGDCREDPQEIKRSPEDPWKNNPQTPRNTREIASHISKHFLPKDLPARKQSGEQDRDLQCKAQQNYQDRFIEAIAREVAHK